MVLVEHISEVDKGVVVVEYHISDMIQLPNMALYLLIV